MVINDQSVLIYNACLWTEPTLETVTRQLPPGAQTGTLTVYNVVVKV